MPVRPWTQAAGGAVLDIGVTLRGAARARRLRVAGDSPALSATLELLTKVGA